MNVGGGLARSPDDVVVPQPLEREADEKLERARRADEELCERVERL